MCAARNERSGVWQVHASDARGGKAHLRDRFAFVGVTDRFDESLIALQRLLGWPYVFYFPELVSLTRPSTSALAPATVTLVSERNEYDLARWQRRALAVLPAQQN